MLIPGSQFAFPLNMFAHGRIALPLTRSGHVRLEGLRLEEALPLGLRRGLLGLVPRPAGVALQRTLHPTTEQHHLSRAGYHRTQWLEQREYERQLSLHLFGTNITVGFLSDYYCQYLTPA